MHAFARTCTHAPLCLFLPRPDLTWSCESNDVSGVWASQRQLHSRGDVSHVRLCARQTPIRKGGRGGGVVGGYGGGVGWVFFNAAGVNPTLKVQFSEGFVFPLWYLQSD